MPRVADVSTNTVRRWRDKDKGFDDRVEAALAIASNGLEAIAFKRATEGGEEKVYRDGKLVMTRVKPSDAMLRLLMQGADAGKYGRTGQLPKKEVMKELRKQAKAEFLAKQTVSEEELAEVLMKHLDALKRRLQHGMLKQGYSVGPTGILVGGLADGAGPAGAAAAGEKAMSLRNAEPRPTHIASFASFAYPPAATQDEITRLGVQLRSSGLAVRPYMIRCRPRRMR